MPNSFLIYLSKAAWAQKLVTNWGMAWRVASRFVAGQTLEEALRAVQELSARGIHVTLDQLGEHVGNAEEANRAADRIIEMLDQIERVGAHANVSIKLTQIGMGMDETVCRANLARILSTAKAHGNFVCIDMEDTPYTDRTIAYINEMHAAGYGIDTVGTVVQSYLYRTEQDTRQLVAQGTKIRLVKGAYKEPAELAFPKKADVDASFDTLTSILIDASLAQQTLISADGRIPPIPAIATHDEKRIAFACDYADKVGLPKHGLEFQMLYGIRRDLQEDLQKQGYPVRIYVPFGTHWYPYFMRRLAERPANVWFFVSNFFKK